MPSKTGALVETGVVGVPMDEGSGFAATKGWESGATLFIAFDVCLTLCRVTLRTSPPCNRRLITLDGAKSFFPERKLSWRHVTDLGPGRFLT